MQWLSRLFGKRPEVRIEWTHIGNVSKIPDCMGELETHAHREGKLSGLILLEDKPGEWGVERAQYEKNYIQKLMSSITKFETSEDWAKDCRQVRDTLNQGILRVLLGTLPGGQRIAGIVLIGATSSGAPASVPDRSSEILSVLATAERYYKPAMAAAGSGQIGADVKGSIYEALKWLDKLCDMDATHGEPRGMRGNIYMILAQIERQGSYLDKADADFTEAIRLGSRDSNNLSTWRDNKGSVAQLRSMI